MSDGSYTSMNELNRKVGELTGLLRAAADVLALGDFNTRHQLASTIREHLAPPKDPTP